MAYSAKVVADSLSPTGKRLTTIEACFPRSLLAEFNTHRKLSRNSASSRAIPVKKLLEKLLNEPFVPEKFGINQPGMQSDEWLTGYKHDKAVELWLRARDKAATSALELLLGDRYSGWCFGYNPSENQHASIDQLISGFDTAMKHLDKELEKENPADTDILNVHKQITNRLLEPFMWHTVIVTATDWSNFFALRIDDAAQAEIRTVAEMMREAMDASVPIELNYGEWHTPYIQTFENFGAETRIQVSSGRCARVSYLTHDGNRDPDKDISLYGDLIGEGHMSPTEHVARPEEEGDPHKGNFDGWHQHRADLPDEDDYGKIKARRGK